MTEPQRDPGAKPLADKPKFTFHKNNSLRYLYIPPDLCYNKAINVRRDFLYV